jgi:hypothetical protein
MRHCAESSSFLKCECGEGEREREREEEKWRGEFNFKSEVVAVKG